MENTISLWKEGLLGLAAVVLALMAGNAELKDAEVTALLEREAQEKKADLRPEDRIALIPPVGCGQTIAKRGANEHWRVYHVCADLSKEHQ